MKGKKLGTRAPLTSAEASAHRAVWRHLLASTVPLDARELARALGITPARAQALLHRLEAKDYVVLARPGPTIAAAYPLSVAPTRHRVHIGKGCSVYAL